MIRSALIYDGLFITSHTLGAKVTPTQFWRPRRNEYSSYVKTKNMFCCRRFDDQRRRLCWWVPSSPQSSPRTNAPLSFQIIPSLAPSPSCTVPPTARPTGLGPRCRRKRWLRQRRKERPQRKSRQAEEKNANRLLSIASIPTRINVWHETVFEQFRTRRLSCQLTFNGNPSQDLVPE